VSVSDTREALPMLINPGFRCAHPGHMQVGLAGKLF